MRTDSGRGEGQQWLMYRHTHTDATGNSERDRHTTHTHVYAYIYTHHLGARLLLELIHEVGLGQVLVCVLRLLHKQVLCTHRESVCVCVFVWGGVIMYECANASWLMQGVLRRS